VSIGYHLWNDIQLTTCSQMTTSTRTNVFSYSQTIVCSRLLCNDHSTTADISIRPQLLPPHAPQSCRHHRQEHRRHAAETSRVPAVAVAPFSKSAQLDSTIPMDRSTALRTLPPQATQNVEVCAITTQAVSRLRSRHPRAYACACSMSTKC